jgi:hypothetical protein
MSQLVLNDFRVRSDAPWPYRSLSLVLPVFNFGLFVFLSAFECSFKMKCAAWAFLSVVGIVLALAGLQKPGSRWGSAIGLLMNLGSLICLWVPYFVDRQGI